MAWKLPITLSAGFCIEALGRQSRRRPNRRGHPLGEARKPFSQTEPLHRRVFDQRPVRTVLGVSALQCAAPSSASKAIRNPAEDELNILDSCTAPVS